jgi:hypothetical protein
VNPYEALGLDQTTNIEIAATGSADGATWITINAPDAVAAIAGSLDTDVTVTAGDCTPEYEVRFFLADGDIDTLGYRCGDEARLGGPQTFWEDGQATAPAEFSRLVDPQIARLEDLP